MLLPAFVLYAREKSAFWQNWFTAGEYAVDILTTLSGFGNILKVGRLAKIIKAGHTLIGKTKTATQVIKGVKTVAGIVEVTSGAGNALLKLLDLNDSDFGREIAKYLFYLEMLSLSGELTLAIHTGLKNSAKKLVEKTEDLAKLEKQLDDLVEQGQVARKEADDLLDHLYIVAEKTRNVGKYTIQNEGVITLSKFDKIAKRIKEEYGVDMFLVDRNSERWTELYKRWQKKPLQGMWVDQPLISKNYDVSLDGPALYLFRGVTSKGVYEITSYTVQHELFHLKMWNRIKEVYPKNYLSKFHEIPDEIHETFVLSEFVKAKKYTKWSDEDILADLDALNKNFGTNHRLDYFEKFDLEMYLKNLK